MHNHLTSDSAQRFKLLEERVELLEKRVIDQVQADNLLANKDKGAFKNTFTLAASGSDCPDWYWWCSEHRENYSRRVCRPAV